MQEYGLDKTLAIWGGAPQETRVASSLLSVGTDALDNIHNAALDYPQIYSFTCRSHTITGFVFISIKLCVYLY